MKVCRPLHVTRSYCYNIYTGHYQKKCERACKKTCVFYEGRACCLPIGREDPQPQISAFLLGFVTHWTRGVSGCANSQLSSCSKTSAQQSCVNPRPTLSLSRSSLCWSSYHEAQFNSRSFNPVFNHTLM